MTLDFARSFHEVPQRLLRITCFKDFSCFSDDSLTYKGFHFSLCKLDIVHSLLRDEADT